MTSINLLPDDLLAKLFRLINYPGRFTLEVVCKRWKYISDTHCKNVGIIDFKLYVQEMGLDTKIFTKLLKLISVRQKKIEGIYSVGKFEYDSERICLYLIKSPRLGIVVVSDETINDFSQLVELVDFILSSTFVSDFKIFKYQCLAKCHSPIDRLCDSISSAEHLCVLELISLRSSGAPFRVDCSRLLHLNTVRLYSFWPCNLRPQLLKTLDLKFFIHNPAADCPNLPIFQYENGTASLNSLESLILNDFGADYIDNDVNGPDVPRLQLPSLKVLDLSAVGVDFEIDLTNCLSLESLRIGRWIDRTKITNFSSCQPMLTSLVIVYSPRGSQCYELPELIEFGMVSHFEVKRGHRMSAEKTSLILQSLCNKATLLQSVVVDFDVDLYGTMFTKLITSACQLNSLTVYNFSLQLLVACFQCQSLMTLIFSGPSEHPTVFRQLLEKLISSGASSRRERLTISTVAYPVSRGMNMPCAGPLMVTDVVKEQLLDQFNCLVQNHIDTLLTDMTPAFPDFFFETKSYETKR